MSLQNFLPLRREVKDHWVYQDSEHLKLWIEILFTARFSEESKTDIYKGTLYTMNQSEFLFSRRTWATRLGISESKIRKFITLAIKDNMIEKVGSVGKKGASIYSVNNYKKYNNAPTEVIGTTGLEVDSNPPKTHPRPTQDPPKTTKEEGKKETKKENILIGELIDYWNSLGITKHTVTNKHIIKEINKLTKNQVDNLKIAAKRYSIAYHDKDIFYSHKWALDKFIKQSNGYIAWLDEGQNWIAYGKEEVKKPMKKITGVMMGTLNDMGGK